MSENLAEEMLLEFLNAVEAGIAAAKQRLKERKRISDEEELPWDPSKIKWTEAQGSSGPYERSEDVNNPEFKRMLKDLAGRDSKTTREGYFYWIFKNGATVGRKKRGKKATETKPQADSDATQFFPENLRSLLSFEHRADAVIIKPMQFLGSENFAKINEIVKQHNGSYVSAGKESHFRILR